MLTATYIIRLYRFQKNKPRGLLGVVEEIGKKGKQAFSNSEELWDILNATKGLKMRTRRETRRSKRERRRCRIKRSVA